MTGERKAALIALRDAVREGRDGDAVAINRHMASAARDKGEFWHADDVAKVIERNSLDAALALRNGLAPHHAAVIDEADNTVDMHRRIFREDGEPTDDWEWLFQTQADDPARAFLLAVLEALIQETPE